MMKKDKFCFSILFIILLGSCSTAKKRAISTTVVEPVISNVSSSTVRSQPAISSETTSPVAMQPSVSTDTIQQEVSKTPFVWRKIENKAFNVGERLVFSLKWGLIKAGVAEMRIDNIEKINGRNAFHLTTTSRSLPFFDVFYKTRNRDDSWIDVESLCSLKFESSHREKESVKDETIIFDHVNRKSKLIKKDSVVEKEIPAFAHDVLSALYYLRTLDIKVGEEYFFDCQSSDKIYSLRVVVHKREKVKVPAGKFECYVVEPFVTEKMGLFSAKGRLWIWFTCDEKRIPVLMKSKVLVGYISAYLIEKQ